MEARVVGAPAVRGKRAIGSVLIVVADPPAVEGIGAGGVVEWSEPAITVLERSNPVMAATAMQGNRVVRTHRPSIEEGRLALRIRITVFPLVGENLEIAFESITATGAGNGAYGNALHVVMVVGVSGVGRGQEMIEGSGLHESNLLQYLPEE